MMSSLKCRDVTPTLQVKGMSILEQSWNSYSKKYLTRSKQYDLLKVQLLLREIEKHPADTGHSVNACHDCRKEAAMLAEADYVCRRLKIMRQRKVQESEDFLMGPATMLGDVVQSCVSPLASAEEVWHQLLSQRKKDD